jgi:hypothetical protein
MAGQAKTSVFAKAIPDRRKDENAKSFIYLIGFIG